MQRGDNELVIKDQPQILAVSIITHAVHKFCPGAVLEVLLLRDNEPNSPGIVEMKRYGVAGTIVSGEKGNKQEDRLEGTLFMHRDGDVSWSTGRTNGHISTAGTRYEFESAGGDILDPVITKLT